ncbi:hypothetical protein CTI14_54535, partial [Methylobacterium radiotolerans]
RRFSVHGQEIIDDYAWLKAENWQTVLKDPAALPCIRAPGGTHPLTRTRHPRATGPDGRDDDGDRHGLLAHRTGAPVAEARPRRFSVHGQEIIDDYAWLKAENWQTVLKDPAALP